MTEPPLRRRGRRPDQDPAAPTPPANPVPEGGDAASGGDSGASRSSAGLISSAGDAPPPAPAKPIAVIEPASPDVAPGGEASVLPGGHRGGFARELTAPVDVTSFRHDEPQPEEGWTPTASLPVHRRRGSLSAWALGLAIVALAVSVFVVWGLPLGLAAVVAAVAALRRHGPRPIPIWALVLGSVAILYSTGWLVWGILRLTA